jgi:hypothetical protein
MIEENDLEMCLWCKLKYDKKEMHEIDFHNSPAIVYVCETCMKENPFLKFSIPPEI